MPWVDTEYIFLGKQDSEYRNMYNFISNIQNTLKLKATKLKQGKKSTIGHNRGQNQNHAHLRGQNLQGKK